MECTAFTAAQGPLLSYPGRRRNKFLLTILCPALANRTFAFAASLDTSFLRTGKVAVGEIVDMYLACP